MSAKLCIVAGDCGVYVGTVEGGAEALQADGRVVMRRSRHLRRYYVAGRVGDGSVSDLAQLGLDPTSPSLSVVSECPMAVIGVRRLLEVAPGAVASFGVV